MTYKEKEKITYSFFDPEFLLDLSLAETIDLIEKFPETMRKAKGSKKINRKKHVYFEPYAEQAKNHLMYDLPLNSYDYQRLCASVADKPNIYSDRTIYALYLALLTEKKLPNIGETTRDNLIISLRIFRDFAKNYEKVYPDIKTDILFRNFNKKFNIVNQKWDDICDYVMSETQKQSGRSLICSQRGPMVTSDGKFHLTENDVRTKHCIAQYSLIDELVDGDLEKSVGRLIISK